MSRVRMTGASAVTEMMDELDAELSRLRQRDGAVDRAVSAGRALWRELLAEEVQEVADAVTMGDRTLIAHELADVVFACYGLARAWSIPLDAVLVEVHRSYMTRLVPPVRVRADGKLLKGGPSFRAADVAAVLAEGGGAG